MNIITFVSTLLLVLAMTSHMLRSSVIDSKRVQLSYSGYKNALRKNHDLFEKEVFKRAKAESKKSTLRKTIPVKKQKAQKTEVYPPCMKLDLQHLIKVEQPEKAIQFVFLRNLLKTIYGSTLLKDFSDSDVKNFILNLLTSIKSYQKSQDTLFVQLEKLDLGCDQYLYYRMIKGTKRGPYPSLLNYIKFGSEDKKICLACADEHVLQTLFSEELTKKLLLEKEKPTDRLDIKEKELQQLLQESNLLSSTEPYFEVFQMQYPHMKTSSVKTLSSEDIQTKIQLNQRVFLFSKH